MYILLVCLTVISSLVSLFYASASLKDKNNTSYYAFVRSVAVVVLVITALILNERSLFLGSAFLMALIQLGDAAVGVMISDKFKTYGPLSIALISFVLLTLNIYS